MTYPKMHCWHVKKSKDALVKHGRWTFVAQRFYDGGYVAPTVDAVPVVRCKDCVTHGNCLTEDTFRIAKIGNPFCCGGKRREDEHDE